MNATDKWICFFATGCFSGRAPFAPGTFGSLPAIPLCYALSRLDILSAAGLTLLLILLSIWLSGRAEIILNVKDPGCIVVDEIAGMTVALLGLPFNAVTVAAGFILFRLFDITKPFPVGYLDKHLSGGPGIVADDLAAGILANGVIRLVHIVSI